jgi:hypothetical protein
MAKLVKRKEEERSRPQARVVRLTNVLAFPTGGVELGERLGCVFVLVVQL